MKKVCLVIGAGAGIGGTVGEKFAANGYHVHLARRSNAKGLENLVQKINDSGGSASGSLLNAVEEGSLEQLVEQAESFGRLDTVIYNLGAQIGTRTLADTSEKAFELGWRMATLGLFRTAKAAMPNMVKHRQGNFLVTSATAAMRGNYGQISHASAMAGKRMVCQSLSSEFASQGIHIAHIIVDGAVNAPDTLGKILGEGKFQQMLNSKGGEVAEIIEPTHLADTYWHLAQQHKSTWTHELDIRSHLTAPWYNTPADTQNI